MVFPNFRIIFAHVVSWFLFFSLIISFDSLSTRSTNIWKEVFSLPYLLFYLVYLAIFYLNFLVLVPYLYLKKNHMTYIGVIILLLGLVYLIQPFDRIFTHQPVAGVPVPDRQGPIPPRLPVPPPGEGSGRRESPGHIDIISVILFFMIWSLSTAIQIMRQWRVTEQRAVRAEADKANAELSFLRAQINPHFLFNTLNNIYSLAVTKSEQTPAAILKLSNIMRYMTDEVSEDYVPLDSEIECIGDYIDLQRIRFNQQACINFSVSGDAAGKSVAPLVIMTFIENVFKYGISSHEPSEILIKIFIDQTSVDFFCQNRIFAAKQPRERTGIGISNTRQRLDYLYPGKHVLNIVSDKELYTVHLCLQLA